MVITKVLGVIEIKFGILLYKLMPGKFHGQTTQEMGYSSSHLKTSLPLSMPFLYLISKRIIPTQPQESLVILEYGPSIFST